MGEIVELNPAPELGYWRCTCGCATFYVRTDEELECAHCETIVRDIGFWRLPDKSPPREESDDDPPERLRVDLCEPRPALESVLRFTDHAGTTAVIVLRKNGEVHTWGKDFRSRDRRGWLRRKLEVARKMLVETKYQ